MSIKEFTQLNRGFKLVPHANAASQKSEFSSFESLRMAIITPLCELIKIIKTSLFDLS